MEETRDIQNDQRTSGKPGATEDLPITSTGSKDSSDKTKLKTAEEQLEVVRKKLKGTSEERKYLEDKEGLAGKTSSERSKEEAEES